MQCIQVPCACLMMRTLCAACACNCGRWLASMPIGVRLFGNHLQLALRRRLGSAPTRAAVPAGSPPKDFPVIITSFEIAIRERKALSKLSYKYLVVDEGHRLKNSKCLLVQELRKISADNKLLLTGARRQRPQLVLQYLKERACHVVRAWCPVFKRHAHRCHMHVGFVDVLEHLKEYVLLPQERRCRTTSRSSGAC
jgi:SNF2-related domain